MPRAHEKMWKRNNKYQLKERAQNVIFCFFSQEIDRAHFLGLGSSRVSKNQGQVPPPLQPKLEPIRPTGSK